MKNILDSYPVGIRVDRSCGYETDMKNESKSCRRISLQFLPYELTHRPINGYEFKTIFVSEKAQKQVYANTKTFSISYNKDGWANDQKLSPDVKNELLHAAMSCVQGEGFTTNA